MRYAYDRFRLQRGSRINIAIFGAGELGATTARVLRQQSAHNYRLVAYFDDNPTIHHKFLNGIKIFNPKKAFVEVIKKNDIKVVVLAIDELAEERRIDFINQCLTLKLKVLKVPQTEAWLNNNLNIGQIKNINFEDLLNRSPIRLDESVVNETITGKVILVTGCAGSIGSEIVRQLLKYKPKMIVGLDQAETPLAELVLSLQQHPECTVFKSVIGDVKDYKKLIQVFEQYRPKYVFHAAAYKHVPIMELFPAEAVLTNVMGTRHVADAASLFEVEKFVMVSTDKAVNPSNVMGASKRIAEIYVQALNFRKNNHTQFITTRFGNVLGSNGSVIPIFQRQIEQRQPITVTDPNITRFFMTIPEACQLVLEAGAMGNGGEIFIFDMGEPVRIADLAEKMVQMAGLTLGKDIEIVFTGLRPGEKLYEELLSEQEGTILTHHPKIKKAAVRVHDYLEASQQVDMLCQLVQTGCTDQEIVETMKTIVPEFISQNSIYETNNNSKPQSPPPN